MTADRGADPRPTRPARRPRRPAVARRPPRGGPAAAVDPAARRPRTRRSRRCTATTRTPTWCCRGILRDDRAARPGRRLRHRADLRHAAPARARSTRSSPPPPAGTWTGSTRRPATRCGSGAYQLLHTRVPAHAAVVDHRRPGPVGGAGRGRVRQRGAAPRSPSRDLRRLAGASSRRRARPTRSGTSRWRTAIRSGSCGRSPRRSAATWARPPRLLIEDNERPPVHLCARPGRIDPVELADEVGGAPGAFSPYAVYLPGGAPGDLAGDRRRPGPRPGRGLASWWPPALADGAARTGPDERWLDLCAGPGGKAGLLGALAAQRGARGHRGRGAPSTGPGWSRRPSRACR